VARALLALAPFCRLRRVHSARDRPGARARRRVPHRKNSSRRRVAGRVPSAARQGDTTYDSGIIDRHGKRPYVVGRGIS
jgi:hypothetical protein